MARRAVLVTGSSGRLGTAIVNALRGENEIVQLDIVPPTDAAREAIGPVYTGSLADAGLVERACEEVEVIVHAGAIPGTRKPYHEIIASNVLGTFNVLEAAGRRDRVQQVVVISSIMAHGLCIPPYDETMPEYLPIDEEHPLKAADYYSCSKAQAEFWCRKYAQRFKKPVVVLRPPYIIRSEWEAEWPAQPVGDTPCLHEYIGTSDLVDAILRAIDYHPAGGFDRMLLHAPDQRSQAPTSELLDRFFPGVPVDRDRLAAQGEFAPLVNYTHATARLGWRPHYRCRRNP